MVTFVIIIPKLVVFKLSIGDANYMILKIKFLQPKDVEERMKKLARLLLGKDNKNTDKKRIQNQLMKYSQGFFKKIEGSFFRKGCAKNDKLKINVDRALVRYWKD